MKLPLKSAALCLAILLSGTPAQAIVGGTNTTAFGQVSNGVLIAPNWVLTARHVGYTVGGTYSDGYGSSVIAARYDAGSGDFPFADLALLRLDTAIIAPGISLNATALPDGNLYNFDATIVTGLNQVPRGYAFTTVREVAAFIDPDGDGPLGPVEAHNLITYPSGYGAPYVESGDSGGGLFLGHVLDATSPLLGITSDQFYDQDAQGNPINYASGFVDVASYRSWIDATMAADMADAEAALWVATDVPEPASLMLWAAALGLLGLRKIRARAATA